MRNICILGSTGSIGTNTLDVIRRHPDLFKVNVLTAHSNIQKIAEQCLEFKPLVAVVGDEAGALQLKRLLIAAGINTSVEFGQKALREVATSSEIDTVMAAIVGAAGLMPTIEAAKAGKRILLANKEALVMSGDIFMDAIKQSGAELLPIDSEHNAIYQSLPDANTSNGGARGQYASLGVEEILLTASGGPFRDRSLLDLSEVTPDEACAHPNWAMGRKISVDSATMMNKGLEVIEAHHLFGMAAQNIKVVIHPQSVIHSMVRYIDGSVMAQLGQPDMRTPIAYGLAWPRRINGGVTALDFMQLKDLTFEAPDLNRFPCLRLAYQALETGGLMPAILNAANEVAVDQFLKGTLRFTDISKIVDQVLNQSQGGLAENLDIVLDADRNARILADSLVRKSA
jgi:1-deoxy-D-xylulose-5-phosphate reductoisomerase